MEATPTAATPPTAAGNDFVRGSVPCAVRWPARLKQTGREVQQPAITMDLAPTILAAARTQSSRAFDGINLLPVLEGRLPLRERVLFW